MRKGCEGQGEKERGGQKEGGVETEQVWEGEGEGELRKSDKGK